MEDVAYHSSCVSVLINDCSEMPMLRDVYTAAWGTRSKWKSLLGISHCIV